MSCRLCRGQGYSRGCRCSRLRAEFVPSHDKRTPTGDFTNCIDGLDGLVLQAPSWPEAVGLLLVATPLLGDACLCVPRRLLAGQRVFQAHRLHLFQRLHQAGWPHARVSSLYIAATALLAAALLLGGWPWVVGLAVVELLLGVWLDQRVAVPFAVASLS